MSSPGDSDTASVGNEKNVNRVVDTEKGPDDHDHYLATVDEFGDNGAHILDVDRLGAEGQNLKTAKDGRTVLIPQPSTDANDPLNWSSMKKHVILGVISVVAFVPDFGSAIGVVTLIPQVMQWKVTPDTLQHNLVGQLGTLAGGALFTVWLSAYFGRLPILVWFTTISFGLAIWTAVATSFNSYMAARIITGFFSIVAQAGGLMWIRDLFFFHEHPRKINIWSGAVIISPYIGPLFAAFIINKKPWPDAFWVYVAFTGLAWVLVLLLTDETIYSRTLATDRQPVPKSRIMRMVGVEQWRNRRVRGQTFTQAIMRPVIAISKLPVLLCTVYYFLNFAWVIGVNATVSIWMTSIYKFTPYNLGFFYFAPIIGSLLGALLGHYLNDAIGTLYQRRHGGTIEPEARLTIIALATPTMAISILVLGFALERVYHWSVIAVFFAGQVMGIMIATTAINAYLLDAYPEGSGEVGAWIVVGRTMGGLMATYIEINWVTSSGPIRAFGAQCGITAAAGFIVLGLGLYGKKLRRMQGRMSFANELGYGIAK